MMKKTKSIVQIYLDDINSQNFERIQKRQPYKKIKNNSLIYYCPQCRRVYMLVGKESEFFPELTKISSDKIRFCKTPDCKKMVHYPCGILESSMSHCFSNNCYCQNCALNNSPLTILHRIALTKKEQESI